MEVRKSKFGAMLAVATVFISPEDRHKQPLRRLATIDTGCVFSLVISYKDFVLLGLTPEFTRRATLADNTTITLLVCKTYVRFSTHTRFQTIYVLPEDNVKGPTGFRTIIEAIEEYETLQGRGNETPSVLIGMEALEDHIVIMETWDKGRIYLTPRSAVGRIANYILSRLTRPGGKK